MYVKLISTITVCSIPYLLFNCRQSAFTDMNTADDMLHVLSFIVIFSSIYKEDFELYFFQFELYSQIGFAAKGENLWSLNHMDA